MSLNAQAGLVVLWALLPAFFVTLCAAAPARAQAAPTTYRSSAYYVAHGFEIAALLAGSYLLDAHGARTPGADPTWFPGDSAFRAHRNDRANGVSNALIALTLALPPAFMLDEGTGARFVNAEVVYAETLSANLWLNNVVKLLAHRPRPYSYLALRPTDDPRDRFVSFYSQHSSMAFSAASAGAYLFSESVADRNSRLMLWSLEFTLAAATATLRVRAGRHYPSDVIVGALIGTGIGLGVPALHGARRRPEPAELGAALFGTALGVTLAKVASFDSSEEPRWSYAPLLAPASIGLTAARAF